MKTCKTGFFTLNYIFTIKWASSQIRSKASFYSFTFNNINQLAHILLCKIIFM